MREHVTTYEEAVMLHLEFVDSPVAEHNRRVYKKEIALTGVGLTVTALALSIVLWLMGKDPVAYLIIEAPVIVIITFIMYLPYRRFLKSIAAIKDGSYFEGKDETSIIEGANSYIDSYNEHVLGEMHSPRS